MTNEVHGNTTGIRKSLLQELSALYSLELDADQFFSAEAAIYLARLTALINREIAVYLTRGGEVLDVIVGDSDHVTLPSYRLRRSENRLSRVRVIHTHPRATAKLSDVDISALVALQLDSIAAIGVSEAGAPTGISAGFLGEWQGARPEIIETDILPLERLYRAPWMQQITHSEELMALREPPQETNIERALLISIEGGFSTDELHSLAETAGAVVADVMIQRKDKPDTATFFGSGKLKELALKAQNVDATMIIADQELSGVQTHTLETATGLKVIDRTALILDIFAQRAKTKEGKVQVSMAQLKYQMSHLIGYGLSLSRLAGGIGTRGPGETKLEMDRRLIHKRYDQLSAQLKELEKQRALQRKKRQQNAVPTVALVGYTNAGKSSLFNRLAAENVYVQDQLFATLDSVARRIERKDGQPFLLVDTVGFISNLPTDLVEAFHATLEEAVSADLLLIVTDASDREAVRKRMTVAQVLEKIGGDHVKRLEVLNKSDVLLPEVQAAFPDASLISALTGAGIEALLSRIGEALSGDRVHAELRFPYAQTGLVRYVRQFGSGVFERYEDDCLIVNADFSKDALGQLQGALSPFMTFDETNCKITEVS